jgi:hypothetical protein
MAHTSSCIVRKFNPLGTGFALSTGNTRKADKTMKTRKASAKLAFSQTEIHTWFERDRAMVDLRDSNTGDTLIEWWDDAVTEAVEDGFLNPRDWHGSAYECYLNL